MGNRSSVLVRQQQQQPQPQLALDGRRHKARRAQASRRRRQSSSRNSSSRLSGREDASTEHDEYENDDDDDPPVTKMQHSLSDTTTSSSNGSSPEPPQAPVGVAGYADARVAGAGSGRGSDLLGSLRKRYADAVPRLSRHDDNAPRRDSSTVVGALLHQIACMQWRSYVPCSRDSEGDGEKDQESSEQSQPASPMSATAFFYSYDVKYVMEQKHRAFWELVQKLLILNDAVVMIQLLLEYLQTSMDVSSCAVFLIDQSTQVMSRFSPDNTSVSGIDPARGVLGWTLAKRGAICKANFKSAPCYDPEIDLDQEWPSQKLFCVPLIENDIVYAVIQATTKKNTRKEIDDLHMKLLSWLGPILGSCMRKCIEFHDVLLSDRTQKALLHIISSSDTEDTVLNLVAGVIAGACHITKAERLTLFMIDWETEELWSLSSSYHEETLRLPLHTSILGTAAKSREILNVCNPATDSRYNRMTDQRRGVQARCALYVPVGVENTRGEENSRPIAVLEILNKADGVEFTFDDECAFEAFASQVAVILRRRSNEIEYIKLLADTRAEKMLAQRAKSQVNILEVYTSYSSTMRAQPAEWLRNSFMRTHVRDCEACARQNALGSPYCDVHGALNVGSSWLKPPTLERQFSKSSSTGPNIPSWDFNVFLADKDSLPELIEDMFMKYNLPRVLNISQQRLQNFIMVIKENYHPNPFHNFMHAFSVVHTAYLLLSTTEAGRMLRPLDIAGCLIAALCHDVDHPGHTNAYEIQSGSQLAILYSDESVLERHHAYTTFRLMSKEKSANILENLSPADYRHIRKMIITAILGTDMANHFKFCETLEKTLNPPVRHISSSALVSAKKELRHVEGFGSGSEKSSSSSEIRNVLREAVFQSEGSAANTPRNSSTNANMAFCYQKSLSGSSQLSCSREIGNGWIFNGTVDERIFIVKTIVHASDLSGQVFTKPVALKWSNMISKEFAYQALLEEAENHPISYHHLNDPLQMVEGQLFFAQKIVAPLWDLVFVMFPELTVCMKNLHENVAHYEQELQRLKMSQEEERKVSEPMPITETIHEDEGLAVPGLAKCTPARFNSFRSAREVSDSFDDADDKSLREFAASAIEAIAMSRQSSATRSRCNSIASSSSDEGDAVEALDENNCDLLRE